jgi:hypothetical protein
VGFLTGAAAESSLSQEAQLFLQKALILNRYYDRLNGRQEKDFSCREEALGCGQT